MKTESACGLALAASLSLCGPWAAGARTSPNIIIILADDLGYGDIACYNPATKIQTPNIDRLAKEGSAFRSAYAPSSICSPTRYSLLTGCYDWRGPLQSGVLRPYEPPIIETTRLTLPAMLGKAGYRTACIGKWHLGWNWPATDGRPLMTRTNGRFDYTEIARRIDYDGKISGGPVDRGFDYYFGEDIINYPPYIFIENDHFAAKPARMRGKGDKLAGEPGMMSAGWDDRDVLPVQTAKVISYLDQHVEQGGKKPFFLYWAANAVHYPIVPSPAFAGRTGLGAYEDFLLQLDDSVGRVLKRLEELGLSGDTMVIFTSDNGPREATTRSGHDSTAGLRGIKTTNWEGGHRVPFIVRWPNHVPAGRESDEIICLTDLYATFAAMAGASLPDPNPAKDSVNILPLLLGKQGAPGRQSVVLHANNKDMLGIRNGDWVYLDHQGSGGPKLTDQRTTSTQLYNLKTDRNQAENLIGKHPEIAKRLKAELDEIRNK
jgi:arylsulfatase A-like enzyme